MLHWCRLVAEGMGIIWGNSCCQGRTRCQQLAHLLPWVTDASQVGGGGEPSSRTLWWVRWGPK